MMLFSDKYNSKGENTNTYNNHARKKENSDTTKIDCPGVICIAEFRQSIFEIMEDIQEQGINWVENPKLYLRLVNQNGETVFLRDDNGRALRSCSAQAYRSLGSEYNL